MTGYYFDHWMTVWITDYWSISHQTLHFAIQLNILPQTTKYHIFYLTVIVIRFKIVEIINSSASFKIKYPIKFKIPVSEICVILCSLDKKIIFRKATLQCVFPEKN